MGSGDCCSEAPGFGCQLLLALPLVFVCSGFLSKILLRTSLCISSQPLF
jgi:hypothetical protein